MIFTLLLLSSISVPPPLENLFEEEPINKTVIIFFETNKLQEAKAACKLLGLKVFDQPDPSYLVCGVNQRSLTKLKDAIKRGSVIKGYEIVTPMEYAK